LSKAPSSAQSETSLADGETEQDAAAAAAAAAAAETNRDRSEETPATPSPPLSPVTTSDLSERTSQSALVTNQTQEATWRDVINICVSGVSGGE
jgi:hypothetical protein